MSNLAKELAQYTRMSHFHVQYTTFVKCTKHTQKHWGFEIVEHFIVYDTLAQQKRVFQVTQGNKRPAQLQCPDLVALLNSEPKHVVTGVYYYQVTFEGNKLFRHRNKHSVYYASELLYKKEQNYYAKSIETTKPY